EILVSDGGDDDAVRDHVDVVPLVAGELDLVVDVQHLAIDADADVAASTDRLEDLRVLALPVADHRGEDHRAPSRIEPEDGVDDLLDRLALDNVAAVRAGGDADARVEQAEVVVDLGDR